MNTTQQIARHLRDVHFGGNWTVSALKPHLADVTWEEANIRLYDLNTILAVAYHTTYYVRAIKRVLQGQPIDARDIYSFDHPPVQSSEDWDRFREEIWADVEDLAALIEALPEEKLGETFVGEQYGTYYRNLHGLIEHTHYHLGQIVIIKKMIRQGVL